MNGRGNLPAETTTFVGRETLLAETGARLRQARLVTLTGTGGVGKTRAAVQLGRQARDNNTYRHGVWIVQLAGLKDPGLLARTVAESLGIVDNTREAGVAHLIDSLRDKHLLLILDNCEHLLAAVQHLVHDLLKACDGLTVLTTSRERVGTYGEHIVRVPPLGVTEGEAVQLFLDRATAAGSHIEQRQLNEVTELCHLLDGLPLAIELAAARLGELSLTDILDQLVDRRFALLVGGDDTGLPHHQTLQRAFEWSVAHCSPGEKLLWARLSVFPANFSRAAAEAVCAGDGIDREEMLDLLTGLVRKSILLAEPSPVSRRTRYRMLETVAQFGARIMPGDRQQFRQAHADHYRALLDEAAHDWFSPHEVRWMGTIREEWPNIRVAIAFYLSQPDQVEHGAQLAIDVGRTRFATFAGMLGQTQDLLENAYRARPSATVLAHRAWIALVQGEANAALPHLRQARKLDPANPQLLYTEAAHLFLATDDPVRARPCVDTFDAILRQLIADGDTPGDAHMVELFHAMSACFLADRDTADRATRALLASVEEHHAEWSGSWALWTRGLFELLHGDAHQGYLLAQQALATQHDIGDTWGPAFSLWLLALCAAELGAAARAARLFGGQLSEARACRIRFDGLRPFARVYDRLERRTQQALGDDEFTTAVAAGARLGPDQVLELALEAVPASERRPSGKVVLPGGLTKQEFTIAGLVADGLTSKQIGERLFISPRTADRHVVNIRAKLGLPNRLALAAWHHEQVRRIDSRSVDPGPVERAMDAALEGGDMLAPALYDEFVRAERHRR
ncbi:LuxR family transcriptional regulator [Lentzea sp. NBRC 105346]|nr:LuxR family transcriptional regulator [Lentzea sp. NBRC 105346]